MEWIWNFVLWSITIIFSSLLLRRWRWASGSNRMGLPPGPRGWPIIGNLFDFGTLPHKTLLLLKKKYGPVVWLNIGTSLKVMVIQSSDVAEELFKNNDLLFSNRYVMDSMRSHGYNKTSVGAVPYGTHWRLLRRIISLEMFVNKKINETISIREKCVDQMLGWIDKEVDLEGGIEVINFVFSAMFNMIGNLMVSRDLADRESSQMASDYFAAQTGFSRCLGHPNISDLFSWLRWFDLQGLRRKTDREMSKALAIASTLLEQRKKEREEAQGISKRRNDFLDVLLDFEGTGKDDEPAKLSQHQISIFIMDMFMGGTDTISTTLEWAFCELFLNPEKMIKLKSELAKVIGPNKKLVESDLDHLHYLRATAEETLRLHPPIPLLIPRESTRDTIFMGYNIPKGTKVFVNNWAIGRDPENWDDPLSFKPERFLDSKIGYKGQSFESLPFGAGRRYCPGLPLAKRVLPLVLGSLLHRFDWELPKNVTPETLDMTDMMGITVRKLKSLKVIPKRSMA